MRKQFEQILKRWLPAAILLTEMAVAPVVKSADASFNGQWKFLRADVAAQSPGFDDGAWETVSLPHTAHVESLVTGPKALQWQGICWYRKTFDLPAAAAGKKIFLRFDGAMNVTEIWVNGRPAGKFMGGYLPYLADISGLARPGAANLVAVRLDNRDNPVTGPKPLVDLDFNLYGGLYRDAHLIIKDALHITDPVLADKTAGGGIFVTFPAVTQEQATVAVQTHVLNSSATNRAFVVRTTLLDTQGRKIVSEDSPPQELPAGADREISRQLPVANPKLWSPQAPNLYLVRSEIIEGGRATDAEQTRIGIRRIEITKDGFRINGRKMFLRGANRHQEYPYIGNALSDAAQYRDALKIKEAGFDYVRCSHYPPSPAFLDACDELGIVVMDSIMGWQYFGQDPAFAELKLRECRQLIRRDRNHPCVILWEVSLNESDMPKWFITQAGAIAHEEFPGDQCFTCGWEKGYDVFMQARQHGGCKTTTNQPCVVSEYGDWEYYAQNAGLDQARWKDLQPAERNSRQLRGDGEIRLLQQAMNFQEAHNDNLKTTAFGDSIWVMFDYNRGYADTVESSGVMDLFRLPKFSCWFFHSQRDADEMVAGEKAGPMVFIANYWTADSPLEVRVFSNCEEIALYLNGRLLERRQPDRSRTSTCLKHPPFTFKLGEFAPGELKAVGYIGGQNVAESERHTPGDAAQLKLQFDLSGRPFAANGKDTVFCYASLSDGEGTATPTTQVPVFFGVTGGAQLIGNNPMLAEAGTAATLLQSDNARPVCVVYALCLIKEKNRTRVLAAATAPDGLRVPAGRIYYTTDGTEPSAASPIYSQPVPDSPQLRAAIVVQGQVVVMADSRIDAASTGGKAGSLASK